MRKTQFIPIIAIAAILSFIFGLQQSMAQTKKSVEVGDITISYTEPAPLAVPERVKPSSDTDWAAKVNNKNAEVVEVLNILNPVAAYLTAAFDQYGSKISDITKEDWDDTVAQLTKASTLYANCQKRMDEKKYDKKLFLDLEESWQGLVKVGVAGVRTKSMVDDELSRMK